MALLLGSLGILAFSFSLPATRVAVEQIDPVVVGVGRAVAAAALAAFVLAALRAPRPQRAHLPRLLLVGFGVVVGFPLLTALALTSLTSSHGAVIIALLPAATAALAVVRAGEHPSPAFWAACGAALLAVLVFAATRGAGLPTGDDWLLLFGVVICALGYVEGGVVSRDLGGAQTICWALVIALPVTLPVAAYAAIAGDVSAGTDAWLCFAYVSVFSMLLGFFAWYAGLGRGGVAKIGQVQHAQPILTLAWSAMILGESVSIGTLTAAAAVLVCVFFTQRARVSSTPAAVAAAPDRASAQPA